MSTILYYARRGEEKRREEIEKKKETGKRKISRLEKLRKLERKGVGDVNVDEEKKRLKKWTYETRKDDIEPTSWTPTYLM